MTDTTSRDRTERRTHRTRRTLLGSAGAGVAALLLAGCTGPEDDEESDLPAEEGTGNGQAQDDEEDDEE